MIELVFALIGGLLIGALFDIVWWRIDYKKAEKGLEPLEHYHFGLIFLVLGVVIMFVPILAVSLLGFGTMLILKEMEQTRPFAITSEHFYESSLIGTAIFILLGVVILI